VVASGERRDRELQPTADRGEGPVLPGGRHPSQGVVESCHGLIYMRLALDGLQERSGALPGQLQLIDIAPARLLDGRTFYYGRTFYSGARM
jgi:hypothetical protein